MGRTFYNNKIDQHSYNIGTHMWNFSSWKRNSKHPWVLCICAEKPYSPKLIICCRTIQFGGEYKWWCYVRCYDINHTFNTYFSRTPFAIGLLSLPHPLSKQIHGIKPLVDYSQRHVVASKEYLQIMKQKVVEKVATKR